MLFDLSAIAGSLPHSRSSPRRSRGLKHCVIVSEPSPFSVVRIDSKDDLPAFPLSELLLGSTRFFLMRAKNSASLTAMGFLTPRLKV